MNLGNHDCVTKQESLIPKDTARLSSLIIERTRQLVNRLIEDRGNDRPPFLPQEFARLLDIKKIMKAELGKTSAVLFRFGDDYVIKLNQNHDSGRQSFSLAHEIGHILFSKLGLEQHLETIEYRTFNPQAQAKARARFRERLCDIAATELLMPELIFKKYLLGFGISVDSIEWLAHKFRVSRLAIARRIAEVSPEPCLALLWQPWPKEKPKGLRLAWRAGQRIDPQNRINYMPVHELVKPPSVLHEAYSGNNSTKSLRIFNIDNTTRRLPVESKGFGYDKYRYIISLAFLN